MSGKLAIEQDLDGTATGGGWLSVTGIADNAFKDNTVLESVSVSNATTISTIGTNAFNGCTNLKNLDLDFSKIQIIGENALANTPFYQTIYDNATDAVAKDGVFFGYKSSKTGSLSVDYRVLAGGALKDQTGLTSVTLTSNVKSISENAFAGCQELISVDATATTLTAVDSDAFATNCTYPLAVKVSATDTYTQNNTNNVTPLAINHDWTFSGKNSDIFWVKDVKINYQYKLADVNSQNIRTINSISKEYSREEVFNGTNYTLIEKMLLYSNFAPNFSLSITVSSSGNSTASEQIASYYVNSEGEKVTDFMTAGGTLNHHASSGENIVINYSTNLVQGYEHTLNISMTANGAPCFAPDSKIQLADGSYKLAKDIEYDDLLLCYNFDEGRFAESYPVWITKSTTTAKYYLIEFDDGTVFKSIVSHRIYSVDENKFAKSIDSMFSQEGHNILKLATDANGNALRDENGNFYHTTAKVTKITMVKEEVQVINIVTAYQLNNYINGVLGSTGFSNMYSFEEEDENLNIKYNQDEVNARQNGEDTLYDYEKDFKDLGVTYNQFVGWRIAELKGVRTISAIETYIKNAYNSVYTYPTDEDGNYIYKLSTSDGYSAWAKEGEEYILPAPKEVSDKTFKGWYNNADGKYYKAGDSVAIYVGTHFTAIWV